MSCTRTALLVGLSNNLVSTNYAALPRMSRAQICFYHRLRPCKCNVSIFFNEAKNYYESMDIVPMPKMGLRIPLDITDSALFVRSHLLARIYGEMQRVIRTRERSSLVTNEALLKHHRSTK